MNRKINKGRQRLDTDQLHTRDRVHDRGDLPSWGGRGSRRVMMDQSINGGGSQVSSKDVSHRQGKGAIFLTRM